MKDVKVPQWLSSLPYAPEFRPTDTEFADPIAYISKIEKEASVYGICKIIPPLARPAKKYVFANLNRSLVKAPELGSEENEGVKNVSMNEGESRAVFTTRQQELGKSEGKVGMSKQVWQSGEVYTLDQFELKAKAFSRSVLSVVKDVSPLVTEAMFWKAETEKAMYIEYANDVPGSGFGEPSGNGSFQYFHKRRRKRVFRRVHQSTQKKYGVRGFDSVDHENGDSSKISIGVDEVKTHGEAPSISSDRYTSVHQQGKSDEITEVEGTAGWKLSNCPWNLQVIARSPGSLTRFMPDDIPGVTSPMVYIGMLFSWFAWHIEDHELHSLNFLHTGSSKTWYSVPGHYAFAFEEVIRIHAYGENIDRLAALMMLGEKTTLMSPEVVVASDIPCCRLVQNPGEFVVTFPRAYHVGFSHGFNCGEAANFGTPQWLQVAKEAAVRRAAMDFLPMLSHQQLLYLLTMSFVNRVPRALLVGARSSRLRDRVRRERELSVKNAFIEDIVNENKLLSVLCGSTYRAVIWDPESLPSLNKEISPLSILECNMTSVEESNNTCLGQGNKNLLAEMCLYMETMKDQYVDDDSFLSDFQVDYGTVACVACGVLGFPFMTVVQPSEKASLDIRLSVQFKEVVKEGPSQDDSIDHSISALDTPVVSSTMKFNKEWNTSDRFLRPRVFCLEHAIQVNELLEANGGTNVLVICHSDFQKIKNHAASIAVELGSKFKFDMVPLDNASKEDLNLIDHAIDEDIEESGGDWSSILGVNLRSCVKMRKNSSSKHVDHALGLFSVPSEINSCSSLPHLKWKHTRSRSKTQILPNSKQSSNDVNSRFKRESKIVQYKRRKTKPKPPLHPEPVKSASETSAVISSGIDNFVASLSELDISVILNENSISSPTLVEGSQVAESPSMDQNLEQKFSARRVCVPTCGNAIVDDSETGDAGDISLIETGSGVIDVPCSEEIMYSASVDKLGDKTIDVEITGVAPVGVSVEDDSSCQVPLTQSPDVDDGTEPVDDQSVVASIKLVDANPMCSPSKRGDLKNNVDKILEQMLSGTKSRKRNRELEQLRDIKYEVGDFVRSPCEGLRQRRKIVSTYHETNASSSDAEEPASAKKKSRHMLPSTSTSQMVKNEKHLLIGWHGCDLEGCVLSFKAKAELALHRKNQCHIQGCRKKFTCHRYLIVHQRVHAEDRPLKCSWKGCNMSFKWAWARTEHLRVHTGEQPYKCKADDCGKRFRFISDFSRHRRKTGHVC